MIEDIDMGFKQIQADIQALGKVGVAIGPNAGVENTKIQEYAAANEFGAHIENGWGKGIPINIPERSFMRSTFDNKAVIDKVVNRFARLFGTMLQGKSNAADVMGGTGDAMVAEVQAKITSNVQPVNAPSTIKRKGTGKGTLYDTGALLKSITRKVFKK